MAASEGSSAREGGGLVTSVAATRCTEISEWGVAMCMRLVQVMLLI